MYNAVLSKKTLPGESRDMATWRSFLDRETFDEFLRNHPDVIVGAIGYDSAAEAEANGEEVLSAADCAKECMRMSESRVADSAVRIKNFPYGETSGHELAMIFQGLASLQLAS